jgi:hypothetical protein
MAENMDTTESDDHGELIVFDDKMDHDLDKELAEIDEAAERKRLAEANAPNVIRPLTAPPATVHELPSLLSFVASMQPAVVDKPTQQKSRVANNSNEKNNHKRRTTDKDNDRQRRKSISPLRDNNLRLLIDAGKNLARQNEPKRTEQRSSRYYDRERDGRSDRYFNPICPSSRNNSSEDDRRSKKSKATKTPERNDEFRDQLLDLAYDTVTSGAIPKRSVSGYAASVPVQTTNIDSTTRTFQFDARAVLPDLRSALTNRNATPPPANTITTVREPLANRLNPPNILNPNPQIQFQSTRQNG